MIFMGDQVLGSAKFCSLYSKLKFQLDKSENKFNFPFLQVHALPWIQGPWT